MDNTTINYQQSTTNNGDTQSERYAPGRTLSTASHKNVDRFWLAPDGKTGGAH